MQSRFLVVFILLGALSLQCMGARKAFAIPAFSRQHKTECTTCHTIYPELNEYGEAFRKNGYIWFARGAAGAPGTAGKEGDQKGKVNEGLWLAAIPEVLPVSFTASLDFAYNEHPQNGNKVDLSTRSLVLQAGGAFRDKAGFYATYTAYSQGTYDSLLKTVPGNNTPDLNELFVVWHHAFDTPLNLRVGRLQPQLTLWKKSNRLTVDSFATSAYRVGGSTFSIEAPEDALEVNSLVGNRVFVAGGVVDRDGQNSKEGYGHVSFKLGGADMAGNEPSIDLDTENVWDFLSATVGAYGYVGKNRVVAASVPDVSKPFNNYYRAGADLDLAYKRLRLRLSGVRGRDSNPSFALVAADVDSLVLASEAEYIFDTNLIGVFRYEYQDDGSGITRRYIPAVAFAPLQNIKLTLEYKYEGVSPNQAVGSINRIALLGARVSF